MMRLHLAQCLPNSNLRASSFRVEARRAESPESSNHWRRLLDSGFAASRRPGMTMQSVDQLAGRGDMEN